MNRVHNRIFISATADDGAAELATISWYERTADIGFLATKPIYATLYTLLKA